MAAKKRAGQSSSVSFDSAAFLGKVEEGMRKGIVEAASIFEDHVKESLSIPGPMTKKAFAELLKITAKRLAKGVKLPGPVPKENRASIGGEPPRKRTGHLRSSVMTEKVVQVGDKFSARSGYSEGIEYGAWLEFGTVKMKARPALRLGLMAKQKDMKAAIVAEVAHAIG